MNSIIRWGRDNRVELVLALLALVFYAMGAGWGWPGGDGPERVRPWGHDDVMPLGPLTELHNTFVQHSPNRFLNHPLMQYLVVGAAHGPYVLYLLATGGLSQPGPQYPFGFRDPVAALSMLTLIARCVTLFMAAGTVFASAKLARVLWDRTTGAVCGLFVMLLYPMLYYSRTGNFDVPYQFWVSLGLAAVASIVRNGFDMRRGLMLGAAAAFAAGTKDHAAFLFLLMPLVLIPLHWKRSREIAPVAACVASGLLLYSAASGFLFGPERYFAHVHFITTQISFPSHPATLEGYSSLLGKILKLLMDGMGLPMLALAGIGIAIAAMKDRLSLALLIPPAGVFIFFILPLRYVHMRYLLPVMIVLACFAAYSICLALVSRRPWILRAAVLAVCIIPALRAVDLTWQMRRDSRYMAAEWLNAEVAAGEKIGFFGAGSVLPRVRSGIPFVRVDRFQGTRPHTSYSAEEVESMARLVVEKDTEFLLVIPDQSSQPGLPHGMTVPPVLYRRLEDGTLGYRRAARFQTAPLMPALGHPALADDYDVVNPPVDVFVKASRSRSEPDDDTRRR